MTPDEQIQQALEKGCTIEARLPNGGGVWLALWVIGGVRTYGVRVQAQKHTRGFIAHESADVGEAWGHFCAEVAGRWR